MKKSERIELIHEKAYEYACSGKHMNYLTIESALTSEGFIEARTELDNRYIRDELNNICIEAQSASEIENRKSFEKWITDFVQPNIPVIKYKHPQVNFYKSNNSFTLYTNKKEFIITKLFGSRKLYGDIVFEESDGHRYKSKGSYKSEIDFDKFKIDDLFKLVEKFNF